MRTLVTLFVTATTSACASSPSTEPGGGGGGKADGSTQLSAHAKAVRACLPIRGQGTLAAEIAFHLCVDAANDAAAPVIDALTPDGEADTSAATRFDAFEDAAAAGTCDLLGRLASDAELARARCRGDRAHHLAGMIEATISFGADIEPDLIGFDDSLFPSCYDAYAAANDDTVAERVAAEVALARCLEVASDGTVKDVIIPALVAGGTDALEARAIATAAISSAREAEDGACMVLAAGGPSSGTAEEAVDAAACVSLAAQLRAELVEIAAGQ